MVSTDAAARGIDIPNVTHVIQADFASSAVGFIHRVRPQFKSAFVSGPVLLAVFAGQQQACKSQPHMPQVS